MSLVVDNGVCSATEIEQLQLIAKKNELTVIPLIQTFGHFEVYFSAFLCNSLTHIFTNMVLAVGLCLFVCLSQTGNVSKRLHRSSWF